MTLLLKMGTRPPIFLYFSSTFHLSHSSNFYTNRHILHNKIYSPQICSSTCDRLQIKFLFCHPPVFAPDVQQTDD